jgi:hypothetical protein
VIRVGAFDQFDMIGKLGQRDRQAPAAPCAWAACWRRASGPVGPEAVLAIAMAEPGEEMRGVEIRLHIGPFVGLEAVEIAEAALFQHP